MEIEPRLGAPADVEGRVDMGAAPSHDLAQLRPVVHLIELQVLHRRAGDNHAVKFAVSDLIKGGIEGSKMIFIRVLGMVTGSPKKLYFDLYRGVGQLAKDLGLRYDLGGHQIQDYYIQRTDILMQGSVLGHDEDIFALQHRGSGK